MTHSVPLIATIAASLGLALVLGFVAVRLRLPALVGYLVAGIVVGPATPGYVADLRIAQQLADIGVMLLMFGVGLHFSVRDLLEIRHLAIPGALIQIAITTTVGTAVSGLWGWPLFARILFGLSLAVASTVVLLRTLEDRGALGTLAGRIGVGWVVVEDVVMVLVLVLLPPLALLVQGGTALPGVSPAGAVAQTITSVAGFVLVMVVLGRRLLPRLLWSVAAVGSRELFTLSVIVVSVGIAFGSAELFGVSYALGAFFAGMVMRESALSHRAASELLPLRDAFAVLFFVSVGMLFDPGEVVAHPFRLLTVVAIVMLGKSLATTAIVLAFRYPLNTALTVSASLAQIGEFSFILTGMGVGLGLLPREGQSLVLAAALVVIALNPFLVRAEEPARRWILARSRLARLAEHPLDPLAELPMTVASEHVTGHVVLVGYGRVGRRIAGALRERDVRFVIAEQNRETVEALRAAGAHAVSGDASLPEVLAQAHVARAAVIVLAVPDPFDVRRAIEIARMLNPGIRIVVRTHNDDESELLAREGAVAVYMGEHELAASMARHVLEVVGAAPDRRGTAG